ncbi:MAG: NAD(P)H-hydrate dehydratase [Thermoanaerobaculia bacterium]
MKVVTSEQMRNIDQRAIDAYGIPSVVLMENAAIGVVEAIERHYPDAERAAIFCGSGNNGGDGLAIARHLENHGIVPMVFLIGSRDRYQGDAQTNLVICDRMGIQVAEVTDTDSLDQALARATEADLVVDAIFGTGLNRPPTGLPADAIRGMMNLRLPIVAVDIPSGLDGSSAETGDPVIMAELTVTFALPKIAHVFAPASDYCGEIAIADISIPAAAIEAEGVMLSLMRSDEIAILFPPRRPDTHKGTYGHVSIVAGSPGKSGAAILSARGAVRGGSGLVTVITDPDTADVVDSVSIESMTHRVHLEPRSIPSILKFVEEKDAVLIGSGLPDEEDAYEFIHLLLRKLDKPMVLDAGAINAFAGHPDDINVAKRTCILTPHPGELSRLLGISTRELLARRVELTVETARRTGCVVILKGDKTLVADPDGHVAVNPTGNPGMATGGMGDVLGGLVLSYLGQGFDPFEAARAAVFVHGVAGDILRDELSDAGLAAMDLADRIPKAIEMIRNHE